MLKICLLLLGSAFMSAAFADNVWRGNNADWYDKDNWSEGVPVGGQTLVFATSVTFSQDIAFSEAISFDIGEGCSVAFTGVLSGEGGFSKIGSGSLELGGVNTFAGTVNVRNGEVHVRSDWALGSTEAGTVVTENGKLIFHGVTTPENIVDVKDDGSFVMAESTTNVFTGAIELKWFTLYAQAHSSAEFRGGFSSSGWFQPDGADGSTVRFGDGVVSMWGLWCASTGFVTANGCKLFVDVPVQMNSGCDGLYLMNRNEIVCGADYVFNYPSASLKLAAGGITANGVFNLNGHDQGFTGFECPSSGNGYVTSATAASLHVRSDVELDVYAKFEVLAGFVKEGTGRVVLNGVSTSAGTLSVAAGVLEIGPNGSWQNAARLSVSGTGEFRVTANGKMSSAIEVELADTGRINLSDGVVLQVGKMTIDGEMVDPGTWGASGSGADHVDDDHFVGAGLLAVSAPEPIGDETFGRWTAGAGAQTSVFDLRNWEGEPTAVDLTSGLFTPTFALGGSVATFPAEASVRGVVFSSAEDFSLVGDDRLSVGKRGISVTAASDDDLRRYVVSLPLRLYADQVWSVGATGETLVVDAPVSGWGLLKKEGVGTVELNADGDFTSAFEIQAGSVRVQANAALGSSAKGTTVVGGSLSLCGVTTPEPITVTGGRLQTDGGSTNEIRGAVAMTANGLHLGENSKLVLAGGGTVSGGWWFPRAERNAKLVVKDRPLLFEVGMFLDGNPAMEVEFGVAGNVLPNGIYAYQGNVLSASVPWAFDFNCGNLSLGTFNGEGRFKLNGCDQGFVNLEGSLDGTRSGIVESSTPAMLHLRPESGVTTNWVRFVDCAGLMKEGAGTTVLAMNSETYGDIAVTNGTLVFASGVPYSGTWLNCTNVMVSGRGVLRLENPATFAQSVVIRVERTDPGVRPLFLASGVSQKASAFIVDGRRCGGTWGSSASSADNKDDELFDPAGTGILRVKGGMMLILR